jgi:hypothetical protein
MERTLLETIHSLGLDAQLAIIVLMFALDELGSLGRRSHCRRVEAQPRDAPANRGASGSR